jgi:predicted RNA-binding Zn-ribbon protein involved in translation (DUF1610 family)
MVKRNIIKISCPTCGLCINSSITINDKSKEFFLYVCPKCDSNVVYYENKVDVISDKLMESLFKNKLITRTRSAPVKKETTKKVVSKSHSKSVKKSKKSQNITSTISDDDILNLKIELGLALSVEDFMKKI